MTTTPHTPRLHHSYKCDRCGSYHLDYTVSELLAEYGRKMFDRAAARVAESYTMGPVTSEFSDRYRAVVDCNYADALYVAIECMHEARVEGRS